MSSFLSFLLWFTYLTHPQIVATARSGGAGEPTFTDIGGASSSPASSGTTVSVNYTPTAGNAVICRIAVYPGLSISSVVDNAASPNTYTVTPNSPSIGAGISARYVSIANLLNVPASPGTTITATFGGTITFATTIACEEFHRSGGSWSFDIDVSGSGSTGTVINTPSITPAVAGELLYGVASSQPGAQSITSANSPWTQDTAGIEPNEYAFDGEYILASSGATAANFTLGSSGTWNSIAEALK